MITTNRGDLTVYNEIPAMDAVFITAPDKMELPVRPGRGDTASRLGMAKTGINEQFGIECIDAGLRTLIVPVAGLATILDMRPDEAALKVFCLENDIDIILVFTPEVANRRNKAVYKSS